MCRNILDWCFLVLINLVNLAMCKSWPICPQLPKKDVCFNQTALVFALLSALINFGWHNCNILLILSTLGEQFNHHWSRGKGIFYGKNVSISEFSYYILCFIKLQTFSDQIANINISQQRFKVQSWVWQSIIPQLGFTSSIVDYRMTGAISRPWLMNFIHYQNCHTLNFIHYQNYHRQQRLHVDYNHADMMMTI